MARHKSVERAPIARAAHIERNGTTYDGTYSINGPMITVSSPILGSKTTQLSASSPEALAKIILTELLFLEDERNSRQA
jgi:hypothetical protein